MPADTAKMTFRARVSCFLPVLCVLPAASTVDAQMYQWVRAEEKRDAFAYPVYTGSLPSKLLRVSPPRLWVEDGSPGLAVVGTEGIGVDCGNASPRRMKNGEWIPLASSALRRIAVSMARSGYEVPDDEHREALHYRLLPLVTDLHVGACRESEGANGRANARLEVRWELSEFAGGRELHTVTTTGSWAGRDTSSEESISNALFEASIALFEDGAFRAHLRPQIAEGPGPAHDDARYSGTPVSALPFDFGPAPGLKFATVQMSVVGVRTKAARGSGFVVASGGWILTSWQVVKDGSEAVVVLGRRELPATVVRADPQRNVALLRTDTSIDARALSLASLPIRVGESVYVVGTPSDQTPDQTITRGIISAVRERKGQAFLQTDAAINPGDSGGPALNEAGQVVGIAVSAELSRTGGALNISYLIPIADALERMALRSSNDDAPASLAPLQAP